MKKILLITITAILFCSNIFAQVTKKAVKPSPVNQHLSVYNSTMLSGDVNSAILALNYYINEKGEGTPYTDTLAVLYLQQGYYAQCYYWTEKLLKNSPDDNHLLEMKGICLDKFQQPKDAIEIFEKLFAKTQNPYHGYKLLELQYGLKRLAECIATAESAEKLTYKPEYTMTYNIGEQSGRTYLQSGVYNIHALALYALDKKQEAKKYFEKALALDSNFALAKQNLQAMQAVADEKIKKDEPAIQTAETLPANKQKQ